MEKETLVRTTIACLLAGSAFLSLPETVRSQESLPPPEELARVVESVERLDDLREGLAATFLEEGGVEPDAETFRQVCRPVGQQAASLAEENGWLVRQMAVRYRNPAHEPDPEGREIHGEMERDGDLVGLWMRDTVDGRAGVRYARRITVRAACLECHGAKSQRPAFVEERYPEDRAYGFEVGDLRGIYSVFVPAGGGG
jgi:hypothetical protein